MHPYLGTQPVTLVDYTQLDEPTYRLRLEREGLDKWIVVDARDDNTVFIRSFSPKACQAWLERFVAENPSTVVESPFRVRSRV